jgi:hypothetical protein
MSAKKTCFLNAARPCDLTCKAAFEVDDPVDNIDCHFIWLAYHFGETVYEFKRVLEGFQGGGLGAGFPGAPGGGPPAAPGTPGGPGATGGSGGGPKKPKGGGFHNN